MSVTTSSMHPPVGELVHHTWRPGTADALAPFVEAIVDCEGVVLHARERFFPSGAVELVVHLDEPYSVLGPTGADRYPVACLTGILSAPLLMQPSSGRTRIVAIRL